MRSYIFPNRYHFGTRTLEYRFSGLGSWINTTAHFDTIDQRLSTYSTYSTYMDYIYLLFCMYDQRLSTYSAWITYIFYFAYVYKYFYIYINYAYTPEHICLLLTPIHRIPLRSFSRLATSWTWNSQFHHLHNEEIDCRLSLLLQPHWGKCCWGQVPFG